MKKLLALGLAGALLLGAAGCGSTDGTTGEETSAPIVTEAEDTPATSEPPAAEEVGEQEIAAETAAVDSAQMPPEPDFDTAYQAFAPDTPTMTVNGVDYDWDMYFSVLRQNIYSLYLYYGITDLSMEIGEDENLGDMMRESTESQLEQLAMLYSKAEEEGLSLDDADKALIESEIQTYVDYFGGDRDATFEALGVSEEYYQYEAGAARLYDKLFDKFFGEDGAALPDADVLAYVTENEILYAKHILFKTVDDSLAPLDDETVAAKKAAAEEALDTLQAADAGALSEQFDEIMNTESEDGGLVSNPDGYFFREGDMVSEFYEAAKVLGEGELSGIVESAYGYHILYRPVLTPDVVYGVDSSGQPYTLRRYVASTLFSNMLNEWYDQIEVTVAEDFQDLDVTALFPTADAETEETEAEAAPAESSEAEAPEETAVTTAEAPEESGASTDAQSSDAEVPEETAEPAA